MFDTKGRKPNASGGIAGQLHLNRPGYFKGALADTKEGKAMSPGTRADYSPGQGHRENVGKPPGGGDPRMTYTRPIKSPMIKQFQIPSDGVQSTKFAVDNLTKHMAYEKLKKEMPFKYKSGKDYLEEKAEAILDALKLEEGIHTQTLAKIKRNINLDITTDQYGVAELIKNELADKVDLSDLQSGLLDYSSVIGGEITGGALSLTDTYKENPLFANLTSTGDDISYEIGGKKISEAEKAEIREKIGGPPSILNPYREKGPLDAFTGHGSFADDEFQGAATFKPNKMFSVGTNFLDNELRWNTLIQSEDEKNKLGFTGTETDLSKITGTLGPFTANYNLNTDKFNLGVNYPLNDYLSVVGNLNSQNQRNLALMLGIKWGQPEIIPEPVQNQKPSELGKMLKQSEHYQEKGYPDLTLDEWIADYQADKFYKSKSLDFAKGGLAKILGV